jgi:hypothetical protein
MHRWAIGDARQVSPKGQGRRGRAALLPQRYHAPNRYLCKGLALLAHG